MNRTTGILLVLVSLLILGGSAKAYPEEDKYESKFYKAYITGDMKEWPEWIAQMEMSYNHHRTPKLLYDIVVAHYGYVAYLIGAEREKTAAEYIDEAEKYLEQLKDHQQYQTHYEAMKGAFIAFKIGLNRSRAIWLGPRSMEHINRAVELDSSNPVAWVEKGNAEYHMPRVFGGSYKKAAQYFEKAVNHFEQQGNNYRNNWMYMNALAWLAQSFDKADKNNKAKTVYQKILALEPDFKWVKEELYPAFKDKNLR
jgi:tetratricopeptide (TPR) repeat protein